MSNSRRITAVVATVAALLAVSALTRVSYTAHGSDAALLRLSWQARGERIEHCRRASAEELAVQAAHMRQELVCEGRRVAPYRLTVAVDGAVIADGPVDGSGGKGDGALYVLNESAVSPGTHRVHVRFIRERDASEPAADSLHDARRQTVPPLLTLDTALVFRRRAVTLVTYVPETGRLSVITAEPAAP